MGSRACDTKSRKAFVAVDEDIRQAVVYGKIHKLLCGLSDRPAVFLMVGNLQSAAFRCYFEALVVVGVAAAAILYAILIIEVVNHFVQQRCNYFLNGA